MPEQLIPTPPAAPDDPFSDWEPARNWLEPDQPLHSQPDEPEDYSDDICPCGDLDCSRPFGHAEQTLPFQEGNQHE